jgi:hypothetical protein
MFTNVRNELPKEDEPLSFRVFRRLFHDILQILKLRHCKCEGRFGKKIMSLV